MTLIGKIFTVLILIMSLVFMTVAMMVYATHKNWRDVVKGDGSNQGMEATIQEQKQTASSLEDDISNLKMKLEQERAARVYALAALQARTKLQEAELTRLDQENERLVKSEADMKVLLELAETNSKNLKQEVSQLRTDIKTAQSDRDTNFQEVVQLTDKLQQLKVEKDRLSEREQQLATQIARQKRVLTAHGMDEFTPVDGIPPALEAVVTAVNDNNMVEISVGADDGISRGNTLDVFRGDTYLGRIIIKETAPDRAVGEIIREYRRGLIKKGDYVSTKLG
ncbi:hypothetical protein ACYFX5_15820 [Bremerella sp. T1]|uniref:hypothetical protein n=1 Tax=Bremerella sp. TYQ1 TaxID=3119568 RepID=UPI001CCD10A1|nr:hypothetical protein [Bremerella volcania]UBM34524.1 hypothetical protein LA756_17770 [Bremerella volcania]